jgi:hypothetical protein
MGSDFQSPDKDVVDPSSGAGRKFKRYKRYRPFNVSELDIGIQVPPKDKGEIVRGGLIICKLDYLALDGDKPGSMKKGAGPSRQILSIEASPMTR